MRDKEKEEVLAVWKVEEGTYKVRNITKGTEYIVREHVWTCTCLGYLYRLDCKHVRAVKLHLLLSSSSFPSSPFSISIYSMNGSKVLPVSIPATV